MERKIITTYRWWLDNGDDIEPEHEATLEENAEERIKHMTAMGFECGELNSNVDEVEYRGWWSIETKTTK